MNIGKNKILLKICIGILNIPFAELQGKWLILKITKSLES
jgi:hypothetical protein